MNKFNKIKCGEREAMERIYHTCTTTVQGHFSFGNIFTRLSIEGMMVFIFSNEHDFKKITKRINYTLKTSI